MRTGYKSLPVKLVAVPEIVTIFGVRRTLEQNGTALLHKWQTIAPKLDRDLYLRAEIITVNQDGKRTVRISFESLFLGGADRLLLLMKESFPELGLVREDCMEMPWIKSTLFFAGNGAFTLGESIEVLLNRSAIPKLYFKAKSDYVKVPIPVEGLEGIWERFFQVDDGVITILMTPYGGKMDEFSESALPFPHRAGNLYMMYIGVTWDANTTVVEQNRRLDFIRSLYSYLGSYVSKNPREAYVNYNDLDLGVGTSYKEASLWGVRYFKDNFKRLVQVKTAVDPHNFFRHEQTLESVFNAVGLVIRKRLRFRNPLGKRTIAGRIVKESYGTAKQQHTFTVRPRALLYCAKKHNIQIRIRSGGHDFEGLSYSTVSPIEFVMIDMINFRSVDVDAASGTAWVGSGTSLGELYYRIAEKSSTYGFPGGFWATVCTGGLLDGGGYGTLKRKYGLAADNVIDARFMDVNGRILDKESMGEDLFWAIRGGIASNFGIVIAWKVKLVAIPKIVTVFAVRRTLEQNGTALLHKWQTVAPKLDRDLYLRTSITAVTQDGIRTVQISFEALFLGGADRLLLLMK
ncbi:hypothetical protein LguiB_009814 [Lonicera macranthoides]